MDATRLKILEEIAAADASYEQANSALSVVGAESCRCRQEGVDAHPRVYEEMARWRTQLSVARSAATNARHRLEAYDHELAREGLGVN